MINVSDSPKTAGGLQSGQWASLEPGEPSPQPGARVHGGVVAGSKHLFGLGRRRWPISTGRAATLSDSQLARTIRAMAYNYAAADPYRAAVLEEAAERLTSEVRS